MQSIHDRSAYKVSGFAAVGIALLLLLLALAVNKLLFVPLIIMAIVASTGLTVVSPNEAKVLTFFGKYIGTLKDSGFYLTVPLSVSKRIPLKIVNFNTPHLKVNDLRGNPIEIGAVVVWRVHDAAQAAFNVDAYKEFLANQSETALRAIAAHYPYDCNKEVSLRGNADEIAERLQKELHEKLVIAGITIMEVRIAHLAYAPEIASAMLKRQQAEAILQARQYLVMNALGIVDDVLAHFEKEKALSISDDKKIDLINNLLVTFASDREAHPVLSVGSGH